MDDDDSVPGSDKSTRTTRPKTPTSVQMETETTNDTTPLNEQRQSIKHPKIIKLNDSSNDTKTTRKTYYGTHQLHIHMTIEDNNDKVRIYYDVNGSTKESKVAVVLSNSLSKHIIKTTHYKGRVLTIDLCLNTQNTLD
uniref:Uncharacterized protein n=1 Tax=Rhizophagus irregularis (strain DAOM 181602 / DAOM 197198 / MUCL 43194) TaxID=747089 RepID=U9TLH8_RHIID